VVDDPALLAALVALATLALAAAAETLHVRRVARLAALAFGPGRRPAAWARASPALRALALAALAWGLATLALHEPRRYALDGREAGDEGDPRHVLLVLDVSPSMRLADAGPSRTQSRMQRARDLVESYFERVPVDEYRVSVVAVYNGAKPVVVDTRDFEVVRNILGDLPMHYAFRSGKTKLIEGLTEAVEIARPWNPRSTTLLVVSDGDTVPATGMPKLPASIASVIVVGVGDPRVGRFIDGKQSRQDVPVLKQIAARLGGTFHDGNERHLASDLVAASSGQAEEQVFEQLSRREYALLATGAGALVLALLPLLLHFFGTSWRPGTSDARSSRGPRAPGARGARMTTTRGALPAPGAGRPREERLIG